MPFRELLASASSSLLRKQTLRVGDLARRTQKTVRALHLYEELGLLEPVERSKGGYRLYSADAVVRVNWLSKLQDMGFSLNEIREILREWEASGAGSQGSARSAMLRVKELYAQKLAETRTHIEKLKNLETDLQASLDYLQTCDTTCEPSRLVHACSSCDLHGCDHHAPDLVAGFHPSHATAPSTGDSSL